MRKFDSTDPRRAPVSEPAWRRVAATCAWLLGIQCFEAAQAATIVVTSTDHRRGTFTELQCLPPDSDVDVGPAQTTVTGGASLTAAQVDGAVTLREAICVANNTPEADIIQLARETYTLYVVDNYWYGPNGLPPIGDHITIEGNGAVIERRSEPPAPPSASSS